jgi:hypothetical protein
MPITEYITITPTTFYPCPFCKGLLVTIDTCIRYGYEDQRNDPDAFAWTVRCLCCAAIGPWYKTPGAAIRGWNRFPLSDTPPWTGPFADYAPSGEDLG